MVKGTSKIVNAIHRLIKEEVKKQLEEKLRNTNYSEVSAADYYTGPEPEEMQKFSNDPTINRLLNETKGGISQNGGYSTMGGGAYTTDNMSELAGGKTKYSKADMEGMPDFMKKAMSGQAAKVVREMEKKNGSRRS